jgi:hypothetical protein
MEILSWTENLLVEWFSSRRILNGMKHSSRRRQVKKIEVEWSWKDTCIEEESKSSGEYLYVMESSWIIRK